ncbi:hypothetical protein GCM10008924_24680 [Gracilibacillus halotolerans]
MQEILKGKKTKYNGHSIIGHHTYNAMNYPHISNRGELIYPVTSRERLKGWHDGSYSKNALIYLLIELFRRILMERRKIDE